MQRRPKQPRRVECNPAVADQEIPQRTVLKPVFVTGCIFGGGPSRHVLEQRTLFGQRLLTWIEESATVETQPAGSRHRGLGGKGVDPTPKERDDLTRRL